MTDGTDRRMFGQGQEYQPPVSARKIRDSFRGRKPVLGQRSKTQRLSLPHWVGAPGHSLMRLSRFMGPDPANRLGKQRYDAVAASYGVVCRSATFPTTSTRTPECPQPAARFLGVVPAHYRSRPLATEISSTYAHQEFSNHNSSYAGGASLWWVRFCFIRLDSSPDLSVFGESLTWV